MEMRESVQAGASTSGRRLQHMKLAVVLPLTVFGLALGVVLLNRSGELTPAGEFPSDLPAPIAVAVAESDEAAAAHASVQQAVVSNATGTATKQPTMKEVMQGKVKDCARKITGDDTPRKLDPAIRKQVLDCASDIMPEMDTAALLKASADKLRAAAKDSGDEADAEKVIAAVAQHEDKKLGAAPSVSETAAGEGKSDKAESIPQKR